MNNKQYNIIQIFLFMKENAVKQKNLFKIIKNIFNKIKILRNNKISNHFRVKIKFNNKMLQKQN